MERSLAFVLIVSIVVRCAVDEPTLASRGALVDPRTTSCADTADWIPCAVVPGLSSSISSSATSGASVGSSSIDGDESSDESGDSEYGDSPPSSSSSAAPWIYPTVPAGENDSACGYSVCIGQRCVVVTELHPVHIADSGTFPRPPDYFAGVAAAEDATLTRAIFAYAITMLCVLATVVLSAAAFFVVGIVSKCQ